MQHNRRKTGSAQIKLLGSQIFRAAFAIDLEIFQATMERFVAVCLVLLVVAGELSVTINGTAVSTESNPGCVGDISRHEIQEALNGISDDLHGLETIKERMTTRLTTLMQSLHTDSEDDVANTISAFLEYIPGVGTLYKASRTFIDSVQHGNVGLNIIGGTIKDLLYFSNFDNPGVVTVHSVFDNLPTDAFRRTLNMLMARAANERVEAAVKRHLTDVDFDKKGFLLVHHLEANDPFHNRFVNNRVTIAKYALSKGTVYVGLISYGRYTRNSLMTVIVPEGFKEGAPIKTPFKFDVLANGKRDIISKSVGTFGKFEIDITKPDELEIELLRNEIYYWFTGTVYIGDLEMLGDEEKEEYRLTNSYMDLTMFARDPNVPLGDITRLELLQKARE